MATIYDWIGGPYNQTTTPLHIFIKLPSIIFDLVLMAVVYRVLLIPVDREDPAGETPERLQRTHAVAAAAVCAFHPAILYDSAVWAQIDAAISAAMLASLVLAYVGKPAWAGCIFAIGFAIKPHPIILLPLLALVLWRQGHVKAIAKALLAASSTLAVILGPWLVHGDGWRIRGVYITLFTKERQGLSELAWNVWWIPDQLGNPRPGSAVFGWFDVLTYERLALALSVCATGLAFSFAFRNSGLLSLLIAAAYQAFAFYELPIGSHERYLYPILVLLLPVIFPRPRWLLLYVPVSITFFLNLVVVAPPTKRYMDQYVYSDFGVGIAVIQTVLFAAFTAVLLRGLIARSRLAPALWRNGESNDAAFHDRRQPKGSAHTAIVRA